MNRESQCTLAARATKKSGLQHRRGQRRVKPRDEGVTHPGHHRALRAAGDCGQAWRLRIPGQIDLAAAGMNGEGGGKIVLRAAQIRGAGKDCKRGVKAGDEGIKLADHATGRALRTAHTGQRVVAETGDVHVPGQRMDRHSRRAVEPSAAIERGLKASGEPGVEARHKRIVWATAIRCLCAVGHTATAQSDASHDAWKYRRSGQAGNVDLAGNGMHDDRRDLIRPAAAQVTCLQARRERRVKPGNKGVRVACVDTLRASGHAAAGSRAGQHPRQIGRRGVARDVDVSGDRVDGHRGAVFIASAAHVGRLQQRIDDERQHGVVAAERETVGVLRGVERVGHGDVRALTLRVFLKRDGGGEADRAIAGVGDELTLRADFKRVGTGKFNVDLRWILLRCDGENLFHIGAGGAQLHVDAGIHLAEIHPLEGVDIVGVSSEVAANAVADFSLHRAITNRSAERGCLCAARLACAVDECFAEHPAGAA